MFYLLLKKNGYSNIHHKSTWLITAFTCFTMVLFACGCSKTDSENVATEGVYAHIIVEASGDGTTDVGVDLQVGSGLFATNIELSDGDRLLANANNVTKRLSKDELLFVEVDYATSFDFDDPETLFNILFIRSNDTNAHSTVTLPQPVNIKEPSNGSVVYGNDTISISWEPSGFQDKLYISCSGICYKTGNSGETLSESFDSGSHNITDDGEETFNSFMGLTDFDPQSHDLGCDIEVTVTRKREGDIDDNFDGGYIIGKQSKTITFSYMPN